MKGRGNGGEEGGVEKDGRRRLEGAWCVETGGRGRRKRRKRRRRERTAKMVHERVEGCWRARVKEARIKRATSTAQRKPRELPHPETARPRDYR